MGLTLGVLAVMIAFGVSICGMGGPFPDGHYASTSVIGTAAYNSFRWKTPFPIEVYLDHPPNPAMYYMHHPLGMFWVIDGLTRLFGFHDWVLRLPPLVYVVATTWLLFCMGRAMWGALAGGLTALAYVSLPITIGFANYHDLEQPVIFGVVLASWGYLRFVRTWRERSAIISVLGFFFALNHDWAAYLWGGAFLVGLFVYTFLLPGSGRTSEQMRSLGRYWAVMCLAVFVSLGIEVFVLHASGKTSDLLSSFTLRSSGSSMPIKAVLAARRYRIELMFTSVAIGFGKLALPLVVARSVIKRSHLELLPLPLLFCALFQYLFFKEGADVHIFWPHYFAPYFALAMGALVASVLDVTGWISARLGNGVRLRARHAGSWLALILIGLPLALILRDGLSLFRLARETGGRFAETNLDTDLDKEAVLRWFLSGYPPTVGVAYHAGIHDGWALQWELRPRVSSASQPLLGPVTPATRIYILDTRTLSQAELRVAAAHYHVHAIGYLWVFDRQERWAPMAGYNLDEREPTLPERWWYGPTEPIRSVRPSGWVTWEWRQMLGQPTTWPTGTPSTADELRIAHNVAVERGDAAAAAHWRAELVARFNRPVSASFAGGTSLLGAVQCTGARRSVTVYFLAGDITGDARFPIQARVISGPRFSALPAAPKTLEIAASPTWPTSLWHRGEIYSLVAVYRKRPGTEVLTGSWVPGPRRVDGSDPVVIARL